MKETDILVVGFGFSAIPLLRELDLSGVDYTIISEKDGSVWAGLARSNALDFDLVSSYYTSFYTFDLVKDFSEDRYPTAKEFYDMHLRYYEQYADRITVDFVTLIENKADHSLVHTRSGECYRAKNVIISTAFKRKVHDSLNHFDFSIRNQTVVIDTIGDSANLMISKLVTGDNRVICLQNGFLPLDKLFQMGDTTYSLDQLEAHQMASHFKSLYSAVIDLNFVKLFKILPTQKLGAIYMAVVRRFQHLLGRVFTPHNFHVGHEHTLRGYPAERKPEVPIPNGIIVIKYWPIDQYAKEFSDDLRGNIESGYLLNDITFFASEGMISLWNKEKTEVDHLHKTVTFEGETVHYDHYIEGDAETPNLPRITYEEDGKTADYEYVYRNNYLGVISGKLKNIYLLGYTRPSTGGLANITEMQGLLIHRMLTEPAFKEKTLEGLQEKIERYNRKYYPLSTPGPRDHLCFFGFYTEEVAKALGINVTLGSCRSLRDVAKYFTYPNNADRYRQTGRYKIEGAKELIDHVFRQHKGFKLLWQMMLSYISYQVLFVAVAASLYFHGWIGGWALAGAAVFQYLFGYWAMIPVANTTPFFGTKLVLSALYLPLLLDPRTALMIFPIDFLITFAMRQLPTSRYPFNDLKNKRKYRSFYQRYKEIYNRLRRPEVVAAAEPRVVEQAS